MRVALGAEARGGSGALLGFGLYRAYHLAPGTAMVARFDWARRNAPMLELSAFEAATVVERRIVDARRFELAVGAGPRYELRYGGTGPAAWERGAFAADAVLELSPRALGATLGVRFDQNLTDATRASSLWIELGIEAR
jgi:hypothetical protein